MAAEQANELLILSQAEPLVNRLSVQQQLCLRQALVRQAICFVTKALPPEALDEGHSLGCRWAARWLDCSTEEVARDVCVAAAGECVDGGVRHDDYSEYFLTPVFVLGASDLDAAARLAVESAPAAERGLAFTWQIAAAQAIARGQALPPE